MYKISRFLLGITLSMAVSTTVTATTPPEHFDKKGKMPSKYTIELQQQMRSSLPFEDKQDFEEMKKAL